MTGLIWLLVFAILFAAGGIVKAIEASKPAALPPPDPDVGRCFVCGRARHIFQFSDAPARACVECVERSRGEGYALLPPPIGVGFCSMCERQGMPLHQPWVSMPAHCFECWQLLHERARTRQG